MHPQLEYTKARLTPSGSTRITSFLKQAIILASSLLILNDIFGGVTKYYSVKSSMLFLSFAPQLLAGLTVIFYYIVHVAAMRVHRGMVLFLALFLFSAIYGIFIGRQPAAVGFGLYIWIPFFLGMLIPIFRQEYLIEKNALMFWALATTGVILNLFITFPWVGATYEIFGQTREASGEWWANGIDRLAGFSRASYAASNQIAIYGAILLSLRINLIKKIVIWAISCVTIYLTTSKTALLIMVLAPIFVGVVAFAQHRNPGNDNPNKKTRRIITISLFILVCLVVLPPIFLLTTRSHITAGYSTSFLTLSSIYERMYWVWPDAWKLVFTDDNPLVIIFGRGIGGVGMPQYFFEVLKKNSADNVFVYLYVTFGIGSLLFIHYLFSGARKWPTDNKQRYLTYFAMTVLILTIGITSNAIENSTSLLLMGLLIGKSTQQFSLKLKKSST